jgi:hypothetical protein
LILASPASDRSPGETPFWSQKNSADRFRANFFSCFYDSNSPRLNGQVLNIYFRFSFCDLPQKRAVRGLDKNFHRPGKTDDPIAPPAAAYVQNYAVWQYWSFREFIAESPATL